MEVRAVGERPRRRPGATFGARGRGSGVELDQEVGQVVAVDENGKATYLEITQTFERALEIAHEREVSN